MTELSVVVCLRVTIFSCRSSRTPLLSFPAAMVHRTHVFTNRIRNPLTWEHSNHISGRFWREKVCLQIICKIALEPFTSYIQSSSLIRFSLWVVRQVARDNAHIISDSGWVSNLFHVHTLFIRMTITGMIGERERANLVVTTGRFFYLFIYLSLVGRVNAHARLCTRFFLSEIFYTFSHTAIMRRSI